jgi:SAM-dependent methyltransferase
MDSNTQSDTTTLASLPSPLTGGKTSLVRTIPTATIIALYAPHVSVEHYFTDIEYVSLYRCHDTNYQFYYPYTLAGDGHFYEALAKHELYYLPWKWEHEETDRFVKTGDTVLELGCATGDFLLTMMRRKEIKAFGTELNATARQTAEARGISFSPTTSADVTCAFQVLEHISDVKSFLESAITSTRTGGLIIVAVPNNAAFIAHDPTGFLNMPPHHMGLWNEESLRAVADHYPLHVEAILTEPLQPHHYRYYYQVQFGNRFSAWGFLGKVINKVLFECFARFLIALRARRIVGHTIMAVYRTR